MTGLWSRTSEHRVNRSNDEEEEEPTMYEKNDFDLWQDAINEMDLSEAVAPIVRGVTLLEDTQVEMYNKI